MMHLSNRSAAINQFASEVAGAPAGGVAPAGFISVGGMGAASASYQENYSHKQPKY